MTSFSRYFRSSVRRGRALRQPSSGEPRGKRTSARLHRLERLEERALLSLGGAGAPATIWLPPQHDLFSRDGYLSEPAGGEPLGIAMSFLTSHAGQLGLTPDELRHSIVTDQYSSPDTGMTHIYLRQEYNGLEVVNANMNVNVSRDGRILSVGGGFVPGLHPLENPLENNTALVAAPMLSAAEALGMAANSLGLREQGTSAAVVPAGTGVTRADTLSDGSAVLSNSSLSLDAIPAKMHYVAASDGVRLAWNFVLRTTDHDHWYDVSVDTCTGAMLQASDWVDEASYNVYAMPIESPSDGSRTVLTNPHDTAASPYGWHDANGMSGAEYTDTRGNNVFAQEDRDANNTGGSRPDGGASLTFNFPLDLAQAPVNYQSAAVTNLFYWNNVLHDVHYRYGFTEAAGNFQQTNYSGQGAGNDAVQADAQDGEGTNNANFGTPPDGYAPRMQMYEFTYTTPRRDGDLDNLIIVHEYGHGVSNRLVGGPSNVNALDAIQSGGMGEGWSDWWGLLFTMNSTDTKTGSYPVGTYVLGQSPTGAGIRRYPYAFNMATDPLTYGAFNSSNEVHNAGEIWCSALWDMTWLLIDRYGFGTNLAGGYSAGVPGKNGGNNLAMQLVEDSLKLMPVNPSFLQGRNAMLQADQALTGGANKLAIWTAFARRGMGQSAYDGGSGNATTVTEAFDLPPGLQSPMVVSHAPSGVSTTPVSAVDFTFSTPMKTASFALADDVVSFTGPGGVDLKSQLAGFSWDPGGTTLHVTFNAQSSSGLYTLVVGPQILANDNSHPMDQDGDGAAGETVDDRYSATFRYDSLVMQVASTAPANGSVATLPMTTLDVVLNEPYLAGSAGIDDLTLNQGTVTGFSTPNATTVRYTLSGLVNEGTLTVDIAAGAMTDLMGNPMAAYSGSFILDVGAMPFPTLQATQPVGGLIYEGAVSAEINPAGDADVFTVALAPGQTLTVLVDPAIALRPTCTVRDSSGAVVGTVTPAAPGNDALLQAIPIFSAGTYTITVAGAAGTTGQYAIRLTLNAALEAETYGGGANDTPAAAQSLDGAFIALGGAAARGAVVGVGGNVVSPLLVADFTNGGNGFTVDNSGGGLWHLSAGHGAETGHSSPQSFYYGQGEGPSGGGNYDTGARNYGSVTSPSFLMPSTGPISLNFNYILKTEESTSYDRAQVRINSGAGWTTLASYNAVAESSTWKAAAPLNLDAYAGNTVQLQWFFDTVDSVGNGNEGWYVDDVTVSGPVSSVDYFSFSLSAGDTATVALNALTGGPLHVSLLDSTGKTLALGRVGPTNLTEVISDFATAAGGAYYLLVNGAANANYSLVVAKNADLDTEANNTTATAQPVLGKQAAGEQVVLGNVAAGALDMYSVVMTGGATLQLRTATPGGGPGEPVNLLDPRLRLFNSGGTLVASDDNSADGRNALLSYVVPGSGTATYFIEVSPSAVSSTSGDYVLSIRGATAAPFPFAVTATSPAAGSKLRAFSQITVDFGDALLLSTVDASDLTVDGVGAGAVTVVDYNTLTFQGFAGGLPDGLHTLSIAAGAMSDMQGTPVAAWSGQITLDTAPPKVISSSIQEGDNRPSGALSYVVQFSEPMLTTNLDNSDFSLLGVFNSVYYSPSSTSRSPSGDRLTINYAGLPDDRYTLTLLSADGRFEDAVGNNLDGEAVIWPIPPGQSGNGAEGGNFVVNFGLDAGTAAFPVPLTAKNPAGSMVFDGSVTKSISVAADTDTFTLDLDAGQRITVAVDASTGLEATVSVKNPSGTVVGTASSPAAGKDALLQSVAVATAGAYTITVGSLAGSFGAYTLGVTLNAALETEDHDGASDDTQAAAQNIDNSFVALAGGADRGAVLGACDVVAGTLPTEVEPNNSTAAANLAWANFAPYSGNLYQMAITGNISASGDLDWYKIGPLVVGDVITITMSGAASSRGTLSDPSLYLYRGNGGSPLQVAYNDDGGPGLDSLIYHFTVSTPDTYYVDATGLGSSSGTYALGLWLEKTSAPPATSGSQTTEIEPNESADRATDLSGSWRPVQYLSRTGANITASDIDCYSYQFSGGDRVSINADSNSTMHPRVSLLSAAGAVIASENGTSSGPSPDSPIYGVLIPATGAYYVQVQAYSGTGMYNADVYLSTAAAPPAPTFAQDYYSFTLAAGQTASLGLKGLSGSTVHVSLLDAAGETLTVGRPAATNLDEVITDFRAASAGAYFVCVTGFSAAAYSLVVTRGATLDTKPNDSLAAAQNISATGAVLGCIEPQASSFEPDNYPTGTVMLANLVANMVGGGNDYHAFSAAAGNAMTVSTKTPGDGAGEFVNTLDPKIELYDPAGNLVAADDNGIGDGRNARINYTSTAAGNYTVRVLAAGGTTGTYFLSVSGAAGTSSPFAVVATDPPAGSSMRSLSQVTVDFSNPLLLTTVSAADLTVDGIPAGDVKVEDYNTLTFKDLPPLDDGPHYLSIAAGALGDIGGRPLAAWSGLVTVDSGAPKVVASSIQESELRLAGSLAYVAQFSEPMLTANLDNSDFSLRGVFANVSYAPASASWNLASDTLTINYANLPDDRYTLTLLSGDGRFEDASGNNLDGEPLAWPMPPNRSGNGIEGGDFVVNFGLDEGSIAFPVPLVANSPMGSLVYDGSVAKSVSVAADTDHFTLTLDSGQRITVLVDAGAGLQATVSLKDPSGTVVGTAASPAAGRDALVQSLPIPTAGTYTIVLGSLADSCGAYTLRVTLNAAMELEDHDGANNDTRATAQSLETSFLNLDGGAQIAAVLGTTDWSAVLPNEVEPNNTTATANPAVANFAPYSGNLYQMAITGQISTSGDSDWYKIGPLDAGDVLTITESGSPSLRGTLSNPYVYLYRHNGGVPLLVASNNDGGPGADALIYRYSVGTADTYYVCARAVSSATGTYALALWLENVGAAPLTDGARTGETEPNDSGVTASDASDSWRPVQFFSRTAAGIAAGDVDCYSYLFTAGDRVSIAAQSTSSLHPRASLLSAAGTVIAAEDGSSSGLTVNSLIYGVLIPATGMYLVQVQAYSGTGAYYADVCLSTSTPPPKPTTDYYAFDLGAGQSATVALSWGLSQFSSLSGGLSRFSSDENGTVTFPWADGGLSRFSSDENGTVPFPGFSTGAVGLTLEDSAGAVVASGAAGAPNLDRVLSYTASKAGTYYAHVTGDCLVPYSVVVTRNALFDTEPNDSPAAAQDIATTGAAFGFVGEIGPAATDADYYKYPLDAGQKLSVATSTPGGSLNTLDPAIEVYMPDGTLLAAANSGRGDGRNASLTFIAPTTGTYTMKVLAVGVTKGEYILLATRLPGTPTLVSSSDTGVSHTDNLTCLDNSSPGKALQFSVTGTAAGDTVTIYADGTAIGSAAAAGSMAVVTSNGAYDLADGQHLVTARLTAPFKLQTSDSPPLVVTVHTVAPKVSAVLVRGALWGTSFLDSLDALGYGRPGVSRQGYAVPSGATQLKALPWSNIDQLAVVFNENVSIAESDLALWGVKVANYVGSVGLVPGSFSFNPATLTATWTLKVAIDADKLLVDLDNPTGRVTDLAGNLLDGEWQNGASVFPSGDGAAGGNFHFRFNVLPGDVDQSGGVSSGDLIKVRNAQGSAPGSADCSVFKDVNGSGGIAADDMAVVRSRQTVVLPSGEPAAPSPLAQPAGRKPTAALSAAAGRTSSPAASAAVPGAVDRAIAQLYLQPIEAAGASAALSGSATARSKKGNLQDGWDTSLLAVSAEWQSL